MDSFWRNLDSTEAVDLACETLPVVLFFKHSTRCSISSMALRRIERESNLLHNIACFYLDLLAHRNISQYLAEKFQVQHESPQIILVKNGSCILDASHNEISVSEILSVL